MSSDHKQQKNLCRCCILVIKPPEEWENFIIAVVLTVCLPLLPLLIEFLLKGKITPASVTLLASFFTLSLGSSSKSKLFFSISMVVGLMFAVFYAILFTPQIQFNEEIKILSWVAIVLSGGYHALERLKRHVDDKDPFFSWWYSKEEVKEKKTIRDSYKYQLIDLKEKEKVLKEKLEEKNKEIRAAIISEMDVINREINNISRKIKEAQDRYSYIEGEISTLDKYIASCTI